MRINLQHMHTLELHYVFQSQGTVSGATVKVILCDSVSPLSLQEILSGPNVVCRKLFAIIIIIIHVKKNSCL